MEGVSQRRLLPGGAGFVSRGQLGQQEAAGGRSKGVGEGGAAGAAGAAGAGEAIAAAAAALYQGLWL